MCIQFSDIFRKISKLIFIFLHDVISMISEYFIDGVRGVSDADKNCNCFIVMSLLHGNLVTVFHMRTKWKKSISIKLSRDLVTVK